MPDFIFINKILLVLISVSGIFLSFLVYFTNRKNRINQLFALFIISCAAFTSLDYAVGFPSLLPYATFIARLQWAIIAIFFIFCYFFSVYFPKEGKRYPVLDKAVIGMGILFFFLSLFTNTVIENIKPIEEGLKGVKYVLGIGAKIYLIWMVSFTIIILFNLLKKYFFLSRLEKIKIQYFLVGVSIFAIANLVFNVGIMLFMEEHAPTMTYLGSSSAIFLFGFTAYAIIKKELFEIKVVLTGILVALIGVLLFMDLLLFTELFWIQAAKVFALIVFLGFGYYLVKSVIKEIKQREELERLAGQLEKANIELKRMDEIKTRNIVEIKKLKEGLEDKVRERTKELEEAKSTLEVRVEARTKELKELADGLEKQVQERTRELQERVGQLEKFHRLTVGRELKMVELKKEIEVLKEEIKEN